MKKIKVLFILFMASISLSSCEDLASCGSATAVFYNSYGNSITLIVDGTLRGNVSNGGQKTISLTEGSHTYTIGGSNQNKSFSLKDCGTLNIEITKN
ncbi:hypothetical protein AWW67_15215 [Roseivirga seohaensis]|uniref:Lipoprotein n=1 Tax=Roseivirga seohaensis TaxID=1914963 RepID=A0A150Y3B5_9BACT|nr:hypothetical protein [Roseivirga seohaensis]KYG85477.1 hypothetical protein AWW67_15215 [Roseivirga seohaensis]